MPKLSKKLFIIVSCLICFSLVFFSCKTAPEAEDVTPPVTEVEPEETTPPEEEVTNQEDVMSEEEMSRLSNEAFLAACKAKEKIETMGLQEYDQESYEAGLAFLEEYNNLLNANSLVIEQYATSQKANDAFQTVLDKAFYNLASQKKSEVSEVRKNNLDIKSNKAKKETFTVAQSVYAAAETAFVNKSYEDSYNLYCKSYDAFSNLYDEVSAMRKAAEEAIEKAKQKNDEVDEFALQADEIAPLPEGMFEENTELEGETQPSANSEEAVTEEETESSENIENENAPQENATSSADESEIDNTKNDETESVNTKEFR